MASSVMSLGAPARVQALAPGTASSSQGASLRSPFLGCPGQPQPPRTAEQGPRNRGATGPSL